MASLNKVQLIGRLGKDSELRYLPSGNAVCTFSLATTENWKDKDGNKKESTTWHDITAFNKLGEVCAEYLKKGSLVFIEGSLRKEQYEKDGQKRTAFKIIASSVQFLDRREGKEQEQAQPDVDDVAF